MSLKPRLLLLLALATLATCGPLERSQHRYGKSEAEQSLVKLGKAGLVIGDLPLAAKGVIDGDTIRVAGLDSSLRLLALDTEETFKKESERRAYEGSTWEEYLQKGRGGASRPVKLPTPLGEEAKKFAEEFFKDLKTVRLERDHPGEIRDFFDRYLAYVLVERDGKWVNYNVECVRAGMSPYFTKYGYSRRFHAEFVAAQAEARAAQRGIWAPGGQHYDDYDERMIWWNRRADEIQAFEREAEGKSSWIVLTRWDAMQQIEQHVGKEIVLLGAVADIRPGDKGPTRVLLSRRRNQSFALIFFDKDVFASTGVDQRIGEYIQVRGTVSRYLNKRRNTWELQIVVNLPGQVGIPGKVTDEGAHDAKN